MDVFMVKEKNVADCAFAAVKKLAACGSKQSYLNRSSKFDGYKRMPMVITFNVRSSDYFYDFVTFDDKVLRSVSIPYAVKELAWYLQGDPFDGRLVEGIELWDATRNSSGEYKSNYGVQAVTNHGLINAAQHLIAAPSSRRAVVSFIDGDSYKNLNRDYVCNTSVQFEIENEAVNATVFNRSLDVVMGFPYDALWFAFCVKIVAALTDMDTGSVTFMSSNVHLYESHYDTADHAAKIAIQKYFGIRKEFSSKDAMSFLSLGKSGMSNDKLKTFVNDCVYF